MKVKINGKEIQIEEGKTILEAAARNDISIPALCAWDHCNTASQCGLCVVKNLKDNSIVRACETNCFDGADIETSNEELIAIRTKNMQKIMDNHLMECGKCQRFMKCELLALSKELKIKKNMEAEKIKKDITVLPTKGLMSINAEKCILCGRCVQACESRANTDALRFKAKHFVGADENHVGIIYDEDRCIYCGQCVKQCPVDAIKEVSFMDELQQDLNDPNKHVVCAIAPSVRVSIGDSFGFPIGTNLEKKLYSALRKIGFHAVFDLNFTADVTILEEGTELLKRIENGGPFPMFTSCCPGWKETVSKHNQEYLENLSSVKSPQQIFGALINSYYIAKNPGLLPNEVMTCSIVPCTAKKDEAIFEKNDITKKDVNYAITTRELSQLIKKFKINLNEIEDGEVDSLMGDFSGAGAIFGASGGVLESACRYVKQKVDGTIPNDFFQMKEVRGVKGIKVAEIELAGKTYKVGAVNGISRFSRFVKEYLMRENFLFVEVMACNGGCIAGGGQPYLTTLTSYKREEIKVARMSALHTQDANKEVRVASDNPMVKKLYDDFLGEPGSHRAHTILHTRHKDKKRPAYYPVKKDNKTNGSH